MLARKTRRLVVLTPMVVLTCLLAACGSGVADSAGAGATSMASANGGAGDTVVSDESYALPDCTGKDVTTCSYDGFDPSVHGFSFANWGDTGTLDATGLVALFGQDAVCAEVTDTGCVLYPAAQEWADQINEAMIGGHCEGMAVMAQRLFEGDVSPQDLDPAANATFDLALEDPDVENAINMWWSTQMLPPVQDAYMAFHDYQPSEIAAELADGLQSGKGYTMGIYSDAGAHAITPFAVTQEGDLIAISVYDNNYPGTVQHIMIDPASETWSYAAGATNPDAPTDGWEGGIGTIELTPMDSRNLPAAAPFDDSGSKGTVRGSAAPANLLVTSPDPTARVGFVLTVDGQAYDTTDPTAKMPAGVLARSTLGATFSGKGMALSIDRKVIKSFTASPKASAGGSSKTPVTMSYDAVGSPRVTLRAKSDAANVGDSAFAVDKRGTVKVAAADGSESTVNLANGLNSVDFPVPDGIDMTVDPGESDGVAGIEFVDEDGNVVGEYSVDDETDSGRVVDGVAEFDAESGEFDVTEDFAEADDVDEDVVAALVDGYDESVNDGADESVDSGSDGSDSSGADSGSDGSDSSGADSGSDGSDSSGADSGDSGTDSGTDSGGADSGGSDSGGSDSGGADTADDSGAADSGDDSAPADPTE